RPGAQRAADRTARQRAHRASAPPPGGRAGAGRGRVRRGALLPVRRIVHVGRPRAAGRRRAAARRTAAQPAVGGGAAAAHQPAACAGLDLPRRTCAMELNLDALALPALALAPRMSAYPPALIDVALVVGAQTPAAQVEEALVAGAGELLESVRLFDVYSGEQ